MVIKPGEQGFMCSLGPGSEVIVHQAVWSPAQGKGGLSGWLAWSPHPGGQSEPQSASVCPLGVQGRGRESLSSSG